MTEYGQSSGKTLKFFILSKMGHPSLYHWCIWQPTPTFPGMWAGRHDTYEWLPCSPNWHPETSSCRGWYKEEVYNTWPYNVVQLKTE